jgi:hypothetical protein
LVIICHSSLWRQSFLDIYGGFILVEFTFMADHEPYLRNDAAPWSDFDADGYLKANFVTVFPEDEEIIRFASNFLIEACEGRPPTRAAIDVGSGPNLYPALLMLPWAERIVFTEYAPANIDWLNENLTETPGEWAWQPFWEKMAGRPGYADIRQPRHRLATGHDIVPGSVFDLPQRSWGLGSMFFVADGISSDEAEFESAVRSFLGALTPAAPFLMAFMEGSTGYDVSGVRFPAVNVSPGSLKTLLAGLPVAGTAILRTDNSVRPVRPGYEAMLLVTGYVAEDGLS